MTSESLRTADRAIWLTIGAVALADVMASIVGPFVIAWTVPITFTTLCGLLAAIGYFYRHVRGDEQIASVLICITQMLCFAVVSAALSYVAATASFPLWDAALLAWDKDLGLDWTAWLKFMEAHPRVHLPLQLAYASLMAQPLVFTLILVADRRFLQLRIFIASTIVTILAVIALSALCPAAGPGLDPSYPAARPEGFLPASWASWPIFNGLRDGTYRYLFTPDTDGIVQFPSYHAAAGLLGIFAVWPVRYARWISLTLNLAMIASTPVDGGHYFVDVFAGLVLATLAWKAAEMLIAPRPAGSAPAPGLDAPSIVPDPAPADLRHAGQSRQVTRIELI